MIFNLLYTIIPAVLGFALYDAAYHKGWQDCADAARRREMQMYHKEIPLETVCEACEAALRNVNGDADERI